MVLLDCTQPPYSKDVPGERAAPGETVPRMSTMRDHLLTRMEATPNFPWEKDTKSAFEVMAHAAELFPDHNCFGTLVNDEYEYMTFREVQEKVVKLADGMRSKLSPKKGASLGLMSKNRTEWTVSNLAGNALGLVTIAVYDTSPADNLRFVINHGEIGVMVISASLADKLVEIKSDISCVKTILVMENDSDAVREVAKKLDGLDVLKWQDVVDAGSADATFEPATGDELSQVMYTSGTTGDPKGVMMKNSSLISELATLRVTEYCFNSGLQPGNMTISYLPNAHIFSQALEIAFISLGICICFSSGNIKSLQKEIRQVNPHALPAVPRILTRFEDTIRSKVENGGVVKKMMFGSCFAVQNFCKNRFHFRISLLDKLIFDKVRSAVFSNLRLIFCGSAPLSARTQNFLNIAFNADIVQGFGMTETCAAVAATNPLYGIPGSIGGPLPNVHVKLVDVSEMGYTVKDEPAPRGELMLRGPTIFSGYYKNEEATKKDLSDDGWFATGDIAQWNADGSLSIIDRKKNIFKLSQGEYVAAEQVEAVYTRSKFLAQIWVYGDSSKSCLVAVGVPDKEAAYNWAKDKNIGGDLADIANTEEFKEAVLADLDSLRSEFKLKGYEKIRNIHMESNVDDMGQGFNVDNGLVTPSMKLKRPKLKERYQEVLSKMYANLD